MTVKRYAAEESVTIFHSDRGNQYTSQRFLDHLKGYGIRPSVGAYWSVLRQYMGEIFQRHAQE